MVNHRCSKCDLKNTKNVKIQFCKEPCFAGQSKKSFQPIGLRQSEIDMQAPEIPNKSKSLLKR